MEEAKKYACTKCGKEVKQPVPTICPACYMGDVAQVSASEPEAPAQMQADDSAPTSEKPTDSAPVTAQTSEPEGTKTKKRYGL